MASAPRRTSRTGPSRGSGRRSGSRVSSPSPWDPSTLLPRVASSSVDISGHSALRRYEDEEGRELLDLPRAPLPPARTVAPVRLLPIWDNLLLGHADRRRVIDDEYRQVLFGGVGASRPTLLVDGFVAGTWRREGGRIRVEPYEPLPRAAGGAGDVAAGRRAAWIGS